MTISYINLNLFRNLSVHISGIMQILLMDLNVRRSLVVRLTNGLCDMTSRNKVTQEKQAFILGHIRAICRSRVIDISVNLLRHYRSKKTLAVYE